MGVPDINEEKFEAFSAIVRKIDKISKTKYLGKKKCSCEGEKSLWMMLRLGKIENNHYSTRLATKSVEI